MVLFKLIDTSGWRELIQHVGETEHEKKQLLRKTSYPNASGDQFVVLPFFILIVGNWVTVTEMQLTARVLGKFLSKDLGSYIIYIYLEYNKIILFFLLQKIFVSLYCCNMNEHFMIISL